MKQFKLTILLAVLISMVGIRALAHDFEVANAAGVTIYYVKTNSIEVAVSYRGSYYYSYHNEYTGNIVIPESVTYNGKTYNVTTIGSEAFCKCDGLTSVTIPNSVTSIGSFAFSNCSRLTSVTIPNSVASIGDGAFWGCSSLTSITIPNSVTSIGEDAFFDCNGLTLINVPVTDYSTFCYNKVVGLIANRIGKPVHLINAEGNEITEYVIPEDVRSIGSSAFNNCSGLTSVTIPNSVTSIDNSAFAYCSGLTSVTIPNSVTSIGNRAFSHCNGLTSVTIPNSVTSIGKDAFFDCNGLTLINVPVTDYSTFCNNKIVGLIASTIGIPVRLINAEGNEITEYVVPENVTSIGREAFYRCSGLTSVTISNSVTSIDYSAFYYTKLKSVTIGTGVLTIDNKAFSYPMPVKVIWLTNTPPNGYKNAAGTVNYVANDLYSNLSNKAVYPFLSSMFEVDGVKYVPVSPSERSCDAIDCSYDETAEKINIGKTVSYKGIDMTVKNVNPYVCYQNPFIKEVELTFDNHLSDYAFQGCTGITNAVIKNAGNVGTSAFQDCTAINTLTVSNTGNIGESAFKGCTGVNTLTVSNTGDIGKSAFQGCSIASNLTVSNTGNIGESAFGSITGEFTAFINNWGSIADKAFQNCAAMKTVTLSLRIISIGEYAFDGCKALTGIVIPNSVKTLGSYAFQNCSSMASVKIGTGITAINQYTFAGCSSLTDVQIGSKVKSIGTCAFSSCSALPQIVIPQEVTSIGDYVFRGCTRLKNVNMADRNSDDTALSLGSNGSSPLFSSCPLDEVYIGRNISYSTESGKGYSPFYRNTSLKTVIITDKETEISKNEFYGCTNLQNVTIGDGVTTIGDWAFSGCSSLDYFACGTQVKTIGQEAFSDCTAMTKLISHAATPPVCGSQALDDINKWTCTLQVPKSAITAYRAADQWKDFFFIEETGINAPKMGEADGVTYKNYDLNGQPLLQPRKGVNIMKSSDGKTKKVLVK